MNTNKLYIGDRLVAKSGHDYNDVTNMPTLNTTVVQGDLSCGGINVYDKDEVNELVDAERDTEIRTYHSEDEFTPEPNVRYYIGPDADGVYKMYVWTEAGEGISLRDTSGITPQLQIRTPQEGGKYNIGSNGPTDGRILTKHSVDDALNEVDVTLQGKQPRVDDRLLTPEKSVVGAINGLHRLIRSDYNSVVFPTYTNSYSAEWNSFGNILMGIVKITPNQSLETYGRPVNLTFMLSPTGWMNSSERSSVILHMFCMPFQKVGFLRGLGLLDALVQDSEYSFLKSMPVLYRHIDSWDQSMTLGFYSSNWNTGASWAVTVLDMDYKPDEVEVKWLSGGRGHKGIRDPLAANMTSWTQLGYTQTQFE